MFGLFKNDADTYKDSVAEKLQERVTELEDEEATLQAEVKSLKVNRSDLRENLADQKAEFRRKEEDIAHNVRIVQERDTLALDRKELTIQKAADAKVAEVKDEYRDEAEERLKGELERMSNMYSEILARLPDVTAKLTGKV